MPTASGGRLPRFDAVNAASTAINATPSSARCRHLPIEAAPITPWASAEMSVAWGAGSGFCVTTPMLGAPANPYARVRR